MNTFHSFFNPRTRAIRKYGDTMSAYDIDIALVNDSAFPTGGDYGGYLSSGGLPAKQDPVNHVETVFDHARPEERLSQLLHALGETAVILDSKKS